MKANRILVKTKSKQYAVYTGVNILNHTGKIIKKVIPNTKKIAIISDRNVPKKSLSKLKISLKKYSPKVYKLNSGDKIKSIKVAMYLIEDLLKNNFNRPDCIIALGGGAIGDLSSFVSSIVKRGLKFINIPTTLLAQVDASIGGKTAINSKQGKNLIGTFHQPEFVIIDISMLNSLPQREMICGYGEILKHALILDKKFFYWLTKNGKKVINKKIKFLKYAITKSCKIKTKIVNMDEKESNARMILNFGHTFGHAFEATKKFSKKMNHGEAVLLGMMLATQFATEKKIFSSNDLKLIKNHYLNLNLPMNLKNYFGKKDIKKIIYYMSKDKKNFNKKINLILLKKIGRAVKPTSILINAREIRSFLNSKFNK